MKDFNEFILRVHENANEIRYDTVNQLRNEWNPGITLSQEDISLITKINQQNTLALLRQYHAWISED